MELHQELMATAGGALIGLASAGYLVLFGRIAGISGIFASILERRVNSLHVAFVLGLGLGGIVLAHYVPERLSPPDGGSLALLVISGLLVGFGTRLGGGCTSGHGVCGIGRLSRRSIAATATFMGTAFLVATTFYLITKGQVIEGQG